MAKEELKLTFTNLISQHGNPAKSWEKLLGPQAEIQVYVGNKLFFQEVNFDIGEFATQIGHWMNDKMKNGIDFYYQAIESDQEKFFFIKKTNSGWKIGSVFQEYEEDTEFSAQDLSTSINGFVNRVISEVNEKLGIDLKPWLQQPFPY